MAGRLPEPVPNSPRSQIPPGPSGPEGKGLLPADFPVDLMLPMFIAVLDQTIVATALPAMTSSTGRRSAHRLDRRFPYLIANDRRARLRPARRRCSVEPLDECGAVRGDGGFRQLALGRNVSRLISHIVQGLGGGGLMTLRNR